MERNQTMQTRKKILVVDDDTNSIAIAEELLGGDYNLKTAATGEEALEFALNFTPANTPSRCPKSLSPKK